MSTFTGMIGSTGSVWNGAEQQLAALDKVDKTDMKAFSEALLKAQLQIGIATNMEQKASSAIDKAYQAHGQVASK